VRLWFSAASEVPIYRQLVTQVALAILSGDLKPGERLPSTRELARRFMAAASSSRQKRPRHPHPNRFSISTLQLSSAPYASCGFRQLRSASGWRNGLRRHLPTIFS
jgi:hypothetical protein